jgi:hypothetical protein
MRLLVATPERVPASAAQTRFITVRFRVRVHHDMGHHSGTRARSIHEACPSLPVTGTVIQSR